MADRLVLLRHASAGDRGSWRGDDRSRPLDERGRSAAERLPEHLAGVVSGPLTIASSPLRRCVETVRPLAVAHRVQVHEDERLAETAVPLGSEDGWPDAAWLGSRAAEAVDRHAAGGASGCLVICSHGEVLPALLASLLGRAEGTVDGVDALDLSAKALPKGAAWVVDRRDATMVVTPLRPPPER